MVVTRSQGLEPPNIQEVEALIVDETDATLQSLLTRRDKLQETVSRFKTWYEANHETASASRLKVRLRDFVHIKSQFDDIQTNIEALDNATPELEQDNLRAQFEELYFDLCADVEDAIEQKLAIPINEPPNRNTLIPRSPPSVQLVPINIKPFDGTYTNWLPFYNTFDSLVHSDDRFTNIQKFHHLKNSVCGDAASTINSLTLSDQNYSIAWKLLRERFENKRLIIQHHVNNLFNLPQVIKDSASSLRQLLDNISTNIEALKSFSVEIMPSDVLLIHLITSKLDFVSRKGWEESLTTNEMPTRSQLISHLTQRCHLLEALEMNKTSFKNNYSSIGSKVDQKQWQKAGQKTLAFPITDNINRQSCYFCKKPHSIYNCTNFLKLTVSMRLSQVNRLKLCKNCLKPSHNTEVCKSNKCKLCQQKDNTLLHTDQAICHNDIDQPSTSGVRCALNNVSHAMLSTAVIYIKDNKNNLKKCRALLDVGSQSNFIVEATCKQLGLTTKNTNISISGIQSSVTAVSHAALANICSTNTSFTTTINCLVIPEITGNLPSVSFSKDKFDIPASVILADPEFNLSQPIDILIGAQLFWQLLCVGQIKLNEEGLILQKTVLGWVVGGPMSNCMIAVGHRQNQISCHSTVTDSLEKQVEKFWTLEGYTSNKKTLTKAEISHENYFISNIQRLANGRFQVRLTFNEFLPELGNSREMAIKRFISLERKFAKNPSLKTKYQEFMHEYRDLNHMQFIGPLTPYDEEDQLQYIVPHHAVFKHDNLNEKIRVVFDGSARPSAGKCLNDVLSVGPKVQNDIFNIITRFRTYKFAFTADICKMYRQILIHPDDRRFQRILWRNNSGESIKIFELKTVTYGMSSAPYAAIKCLQLLAEEAAQIFPKAAETIRDDFYVDDVLSGSQTLEETLLLRDQIRTILSNGCFNLAKWASNDPHILMENQNQTSLVKFDHKNDESKTLGLLWDTKRDCFQYSIQKILLSGKVTKRKILSISSKIYDPLGLLGPVTLTAKILIQDLWALKLGWDESIPISTHSAWTAWAKDLENLNQIEIPRNIFQTSGILELHCFCDASNKAYGGAIYVRSLLSDGTKHIHLLCAKSRVAPLKTTQLPRLELCGALLVSQLCDTVLKTVKVPIKNKYFWTDSKITLAWISSQSSSLKTFVANRVSEIQNLTHIDEWKYVPTASNPADLISRGLTPNRLINNSFWFNGPAFLAYPEQLWPVQEPVTISEIPERKKTTCLISNINNDWDYLTRFSNFTKLTRSVSYLNRFIANIFKNKNNPNYGPLTILELDQSVIIILKHIQKTEFFAEIKLLSKNSSIQSNSKLLCLNPFLDNNGILRVGGRLDYAPNISDLHKHPYLLPKRHYVTKLIICHFHQTHLHAGPQATLAALRQKFWILTGRSVVRQELRKCSVL